ncbi:hypothetical protein N7481_006664 [Penicillium waksmanii]|uniref:uncharacterized protein n=1 Tax=Penicillium waksmanii TaxID=69791 RepID=UPI002547563E|nr:uncharacterized protein N7481_006664 [Penicillium waksmanii]KAJ5984565.1 hypothetical protein N7481_006664 [Penicillium waksmanii]
MAVDPAILAVFGPIPAGVDLTDSDVNVNNGAVIAMLCLSTVAVILRFVARVTLRNALMADDWAIIIALVSYLFNFIKLICSLGIDLGISKGLYRCYDWYQCRSGTGSGRHIWAVSLDELMQLYKLLFSYTFLYASSCTWTRISILFFYRRIFSPLEIYLKVALAIAGFLAISYPIVIWVTMSTACKPVSYFWTQFSGTEGKCIDVNKFFLALGIINMINDIIILVIPFPRIIRLQMSARKKIAICAIMAVGIFACVASIVRIYYLHVFSNAIDVTWLMGPVFIWSTIEPSVAMVCACLPHLAPLARLARQTIFSSLHSHKSKTGDSWRPPHSLTRPDQEPQRKIIFGSSGVKFDYGLAQMRRDANDDEIGLTNYVTSNPNHTKNSSVESVSEDYHRGHTITVQSSFAQATTSRPPS